MFCLHNYHNHILLHKCQSVRIVTSAILYTCTGTNATGVKGMKGGDVSVALVTIARCKCQSVWIVTSAILYTFTGTNATGVKGDVGVTLP